jgi:hypothetical protein
LVEVKVTLVGVKVTLVEVKVTLVGVKVTLVGVKVTLVEVETTLVGVKVTLVEVKTTLVGVKVTLVEVETTLVGVGTILVGRPMQVATSAVKISVNKNWLTHGETVVLPLSSVQMVVVGWFEQPDSPSDAA